MLVLLCAVYVLVWFVVFARLFACGLIGFAYADVWVVVDDLCVGFMGILGFPWFGCLLG